jgi:hypothetical protein
MLSNGFASSTIFGASTKSLIAKYIYVHFKTQPFRMSRNKHTRPVRSSLSISTCCGSLVRRTVNPFAIRAFFVDKDEEYRIDAAFETSFEEAVELELRNNAAWLWKSELRTGGTTPESTVI